MSNYLKPGFVNASNNIAGVDSLDFLEGGKKYDATDDTGPRHLTDKEVGQFKNNINNMTLDETLKKGYEELTSMNLTDENDIKKIYAAKLFLKDKRIQYFYFFTWYSKKYEKLIKTYPSISDALKAMLFTAIYDREYLLTENNKNKFNFVLSSIPTDNFCENVNCIMPDILENWELYSKKPKLFRIGDMVEYGVPIDFAPLFLHGRINKITKYGSGYKKVGVFTGITFDFKMPILGFIENRRQNKTVFRKIKYSENIFNIVLKSITGNLDGKERGIVVSVVQEANWIRLISDNKTSESCEDSFVILKSFVCTAFNNDLIETKVFVSNILCLEKEDTVLTASDEEKIANKKLLTESRPFITEIDRYYENLKREKESKNLKQKEEYKNETSTANGSFTEARKNNKRKNDDDDDSINEIVKNKKSNIEFISEKEEDKKETKDDDESVTK